MCVYVCVYVCVRVCVCVERERERERDLVRVWGGELGGALKEGEKLVSCVIEIKTPCRNKHLISKGPL